MVSRIVVGAVLVVVGLIALVVNVVVAPAIVPAVTLMIVTWVGILAGTTLAAYGVAMLVKRAA